VKLSVRPIGRALGRTFPFRWWAQQSLRARLTLIATALFTIAVATGAVLLLQLQRYALVRILDQSASATAKSVATTYKKPQLPAAFRIDITSAGVTAVQVVDADDGVVGASSGSRVSKPAPLLDADQLAGARAGRHFTIHTATSDAPLRVLGRKVGSRTVLVATDLSRVNDSVRILGQAALIGGPLAVLLMAVATYTVVALTLRPVAALRHGASDITAAGLADQRLPVPGAQDEIHRLAVTLNAMLDRIDFATKRQRTFVGDAAHELRSPLASLRVQLEVTQRLGPATDNSSMIEDVLVDVSRLERLVNDLLVLARLDERQVAPRRESVELDQLVEDVTAGYLNARVPVQLAPVGAPITIDGDADGLRRVAVNLIDNAVRYAASQVTVGLAATETRGRGFATLTVTDDGPGIPIDERERVFDRFYRVNASRSRDSGGTGLGLPIVRDLVRAHGGTVRLTTPASGEGLEAVVVLPIPPRAG
jgi:signal transduction histidine kinase